uniref:Putative F-box protein n=1 Tax=Noccaea caerulescens TaxID=107243 RepID=A0A1J3JAP5_NOCCA
MYDHRTLTDCALNEQLESNKSHLVKLGPTLPDNGEKIRNKIASLEEEKQRRASLASKTEKENEVEDVVLKESCMAFFDLPKEDDEASLPRKLLFAFPDDKNDNKWDFNYRSMEMTTVEALPHPYFKSLLVQKGEDLTPGAAVYRCLNRPNRPSFEPFRESTCGLEPFHSTRGWLCFTDTQDTYGRKKWVARIFSPSTGQTIDLDSPDTKRKCVRYFLGYEPKSSTYKVLCVAGEQRLPCEPCEYFVMTLGNEKRSWRLIRSNQPHYSLLANGDGLCIEGSLYFVGSVVNGHNNGHNLENVIINFDLSKETFTIVGDNETVGENATGKFIAYSTILVNFQGRLGTISTDDGECSEYSIPYVTEKTGHLVLRVLIDSKWSKREIPPFWKKHFIKRKVAVWDTDPVTYKLKIVGLTRSDEILLAPEYFDPVDAFFIYSFQIETATECRMPVEMRLRHRRVCVYPDHVLTCTPEEHELTCIPAPDDM